MVFLPIKIKDQASLYLQHFFSNTILYDINIQKSFNVGLTGIWTSFQNMFYINCKKSALNTDYFTPSKSAGYKFFLTHSQKRHIGVHRGGGKVGLRKIFHEIVPPKGAPPIPMWMEK